MYLNFFVTYVLDPTAAAGMNDRRGGRSLRISAAAADALRVFGRSICKRWWSFRRSTRVFATPALRENQKQAGSAFSPLSPPERSGRFGKQAGKGLKSAGLWRAGIVGRASLLPFLPRSKKGRRLPGPRPRDLALILQGLTLFGAVAQTGSFSQRGQVHSPCPRR